MRIPKQCKPEALTAKASESRSQAIIGHASYDGTLGTLDVTNGRALARIKVESEEGDELTGLIPTMLFPAARKGAATVGVIHVGDTTAKAVNPKYGDMSAPLLTDDVFPDVQTVLSGARKADGQKIRLDVKLLKALADALGTDRLELTLPALRDGFEHVADAVYVKPVSTRSGDNSIDGEGVIMPITA